MADSVIAFSCTIGANGKDQSHKWSDDKLKSLWSSLLNLEFVSKCHEDLEVQGILLLLETTFSVFKNLKKRYDDAESACQFMKRDLESAKEDLCRMKEDLKCHNKVSCERCPELERELGAYKKKLEYNEHRIRSIVSILSMNNSSEDSDINLQSSPKTAIVKAYDLVSQMLLDSDVTNVERDKICGVRSRTKQLGLDSAESPQVRTPAKKRKKQNKMSAKVHILSVKDGGRDTETLCYGATLAPESVSAVERNVCSDVEQEIVPETLFSLDPAKFSDKEKAVPQCSDVDLTEKTDHFQTTTKKEVLEEKVKQRSSPILGSCSRKSTYKIAHCSNYSVTVVESPHKSPVPSQTGVLNVKSDDPTVINNCKDDVDRSPSLLKIQSGALSSVVRGTGKVEENGQERKNEKCGQNAVKPQEDNQRSTKAVKADFWKLNPIPHVNVSNRNPRDVRSCRLKQTTLSLACLPKKQDLCTLKEFNGGMRQSMFGSSSLADEINGDHDEEASLKLAIQESLNEKENRESGPSEDESPGVRSLKIDPAEDDDDLILASPDALQPRTSPRQKLSRTRDRPAVIRKGDMSNMTSKKEPVQPVTGSKAMDETWFVPLHTSTVQDGSYSSREIKRASETEGLSSRQNFEEPHNVAAVNNRKESEIVRKHDCSFDRIPEKVSTSPNYKYRRDALRNREARRKLDGWECEQCKNYYAITSGGADPTEMKRHLKRCSRHRDKYCFQTHTPPGFWNVNFPNTEESNLEDALK